ncbi:MAG: hypothetical protein J6X67_11890 [Treponema sp.]|nr:hypothetical protein [Treponema sp.]
MLRCLLVFIVISLLLLVALAVAVLHWKRKVSSPARMESETILELIRRQNKIDAELEKMTAVVCKLTKMMGAL